MISFRGVLVLLAFTALAVYAGIVTVDLHVARSRPVMVQVDAVRCECPVSNNFNYKISALQTTLIVPPGDPDIAAATPPGYEPPRILSLNLLDGATITPPQSWRRK
jgi:hypothetical protein